MVFFLFCRPSMNGFVCSIINYLSELSKMRQSRQKNTGEIAKEQALLAYLRKEGIDFTNDEVIRTMDGLQVCTSASEHDKTHPVFAIAKKLGGDTANKDGLVWLKIKHPRARSLLVQGLLWITAGVIFCMLIAHNLYSGPPTFLFE